MTQKGKLLMYKCTARPGRETTEKSCRVQNFRRMQKRQQKEIDVRYAGKTPVCASSQVEYLVEQRGTMLP
jgi:hypothetical protein